MTGEVSTKPNNVRMFILREPYGFRGGSDGSGGALTQALAADFTAQLFEAYEWPEPQKNEEAKFLIGQGRNVARVVHLGFKPGESTLEFNLLTGIFLYLGLGGATTTGTDLSTPFTDTVASISGNVITLNTHTSMTDDEHIGRTLIMTSGTDIDKTFWITDNTASTLTIWPTPSNIAASDSLKIVEAPYTHTITEADSLPSFDLHLEHIPSGQEIYVDLQGCLVKAVELGFEAGGDTPTKCSVDLIVAKEISGSALSDPPSALEKEFFNFSNLSTFTLTYNGANFDDDLINQCDKFTWRIENAIDMKNVFGDNYPNKVLIGTRTYSFKPHIYIRTNLFHTISRLFCPNYASQYGTSGYYAGPIALTFKTARSATDYLQISHTHLRLTGDFKNQSPSWEDKELGLDLSFEQAPLDSVAVEVMDDLHAGYYEAGE